MPLSVNIGGTYKGMADGWVNIGGIWKKIDKVSTNIGGVWKEGHSSYYKGYAVPKGPNVLLSQDLTSWTTVPITTNPAGGQIANIAFGNGMWVALGSYGGSSTTVKLYYSKDCVNWTQAKEELYLSDLQFVNGVFYVTKATVNGYYYSTNGITWTWKTIGGWRSDEAISAFAYNGSRLYAAGSYNVTNVGAYSTDNGSSWTLCGVTNYVGSPFKVAGGNGVFVSLGSYVRYLRYSSTTTSWTSTSNLIARDTDGKTVVFGNGYFLFNQGSSVWRSTNGSAWTSLGAIIPDVGYTGSDDYITFVNGIFVSNGENKLAYSTNNGTSWTLVTHNLGTFGSMAYGS